MATRFNTATGQFAELVELANPSLTDVVGRQKVSQSQNIYEADFEYGSQPLRWEALTVGGGTVTHLPQQGGVRLRVTTAGGDIAIRQSRPYHRYQPGKTMYVATAFNFGAALTNNLTRVGAFDDSNGVFFEQAAPTANNPSGMGVVVRTDTSGIPVDTRIPLPNWSGDQAAIKNLNWANIQMLWLEYAWYGAGTIRWGVLLNGVQITLHQIGFGNLSGQTVAWDRTGNLPTRYELRNIGVIAAQNDAIHYGLSVLVEGRIDDQRGFTYSYGMAPATPLRVVTAGTRFPLLSFRGRQMGTLEAGNTTGVTLNTGAITAGTTTSLTVTGTPMTVDQFRGRCVNYIVAVVSYTARITSNSTSQLTLVDVVTGGALAVAPVAGQNYTIGLINRGQLLPRQLYIQSSAICVVEIIQSTPLLPIALTAPAFTSLNTLGSVNSFAERDVSATALSGGEVVFAFVSPNNQLQTIDLSNLFPLFNTIRGGNTDILTVAITGTANVGCHFVCQEAMS
jgi:hypothetical protein